MKNNENYFAAVDIAKENLMDLNARGSDAVGDNALELLDSLLTTEEIAESNLRIALIGELIKARQDKGLSQRKLGELSGVKQPIIARIERGTTNPQLDTILKLLAPLGKTLAIVPIKD